MKRAAIVALAVATGAAGLAQTPPQARAAEAPQPARSLEQVRAEALGAMRAGELQEVRKRGNRGWRGNRSVRNRGWRSGRSYRYRGNRGRGRNGAIAAGVAGLAIGAIVAGSAARSYNGGRTRSWCASRFRSYDPRSGTYLGYDGLRHACP